MGHDTHAAGSAVAKPAEVADILGVHKNTVLRWLNTGDLVGTKVGSTWLVPRGEIDRILNPGS